MKKTIPDRPIGLLKKAVEQEKIFPLQAGAEIEFSTQTLKHGFRTPGFPTCGIYGRGVTSVASRRRRPCPVRGHFERSPEPRGTEGSFSALISDEPS
jgi:hypothetical protein